LPEIGKGQIQSVATGSIVDWIRSHPAYNNVPFFGGREFLPDRTKTTVAMIDSTSDKTIYAVSGAPDLQTLTAADRYYNGVWRLEGLDIGPAVSVWTSDRILVKASDGEPADVLVKGSLDTAELELRGVRNLYATGWNFRAGSLLGDAPAEMKFSATSRIETAETTGGIARTGRLELAANTTFTSAIPWSVTGDFLTGTGVTATLGSATTVGGNVTLASGTNLSGTAFTATGSFATTSSTVSVKSLTVGGDATLAGSFTLETLGVTGTLRVKNGASLVHPTSTSSAVYALKVTANSAVVEAGGRLDASGRGYPGGSNQDNTKPYTYNLLQSSDTDARGGNHGGLGGRPRTTTTLTDQMVYGDLVRPVLPGGGGHSTVHYCWDASDANGGAGGGVLRLTIASSLQIDGDLRAIGGYGRSADCSGAWEGGGGGAGGSIWIEAGSFSGNGWVYARGGDGGDGGTGGSDGSGGGGGRIAVHSANVTFPTNHLSARGGLSPSLSKDWQGGAGTIVFLDTPGSVPDLRIDGENLPGQETRIVDVGQGRVHDIGWDRVTLWDLSLSRPGNQPWLLGRLVRFGTATTGTLFPITTDYSSTTLVVNNGGTDLRNILTTGQTVRGVHRYRNVTVTGGAVLRVGDILRIEGTQTGATGTQIIGTVEKP